MPFATVKSRFRTAAPAGPLDGVAPRGGGIVKTAFPVGGIPFGPKEPPNREAGVGRIAATFAAARPSPDAPGRSEDGNPADAAAEIPEARRG